MYIVMNHTKPYCAIVALLLRSRYRSYHSTPTNGLARLSSPRCLSRINASIFIDASVSPRGRRRQSNKDQSVMTRWSVLVEKARERTRGNNGNTKWTLDMV